MKINRSNCRKRAHRVRNEREPILVQDDSNIYERNHNDHIKTIVNREFVRNLYVSSLYFDRLRLDVCIVVCALVFQTDDVNRRPPYNRLHVTVPDICVPRMMWLVQGNKWRDIIMSRLVVKQVLCCIIIMEWTNIQYCNIEDSNLIFSMHVYLMDLHILSDERSRSRSSF